jgi:hypothetical protein
VGIYEKKYEQAPKGAKEKTENIFIATKPRLVWLKRLAETSGSNACLERSLRERAQKTRSKQSA